VTENGRKLRQALAESMAETPSTPGSGAEDGGDSQQTGVEVPTVSPAPDPASASAADAAEPIVSEDPVSEPSAEPEEPPADAPDSGDSTSSGWVASVASDSEPAAAEPARTFEPPAAAAVEPPAPAPEPAPAEVAAPQPEGVAASLSVPPLDSEPGTGGEWELLVSRVQGWLGSGEPQRQWQRIRGPLKALAILVGVILALRLYTTAVNTLDAIPVVSGLLELTGLIAVLRFMLTRLVRSSDRRQVLDQWKGLWKDFRGQS